MFRKGFLVPAELGQGAWKFGRSRRLAWIRCAYGRDGDWNGPRGG